MDSFKKLICIIYLSLLFSTTQSWAYPYYYFNKKSNNFTEREFRRYIAPQVKSIVQEYYFILKKMDPLQGSSIHFRNKIHQIKSKWDKGRKNCQISKKILCKDVLTRLHQDLRHSDKKTFALMKKKMVNSKIKVEAKFRLNEELGKILNLNYKILHLIEENLILHSQNQGILPQKKMDKIDYLLQRMLTHSGNTLTLFLESKLKRNFEFLWVNFIQNLESKIIYEKNAPYLLTRLGDLNIAWNSFHMKISKGKYKLSKSSRKILKNMHSRWNSILKIILAP